MTRLTHMPVVLIVLLLFTATLACWSIFPALLVPIKVVKAFDDTLLAAEPFQISDIRASIAHAQVLMSRKEWTVSLRLIRDARNQWEAFVPIMRTAYTGYAWSDKDIQQSVTLWNSATNAIQQKNISSARRALQQLEDLISKYRVQAINRTV